MATRFSLKQGETRTSHGPIPHPLNVCFKTHQYYHAIILIAQQTTEFSYVLIGNALWYWGIGVEFRPIQTHQTYRLAETTMVSNHNVVSFVF